MEMVETALYNGVLPTISLDGTRYFYVNALKKVNGLPCKVSYQEINYIVKPYY